MASPRELYDAYMRGWRHGAIGQASDPVLARHPDARVGGAYVSGRNDGVRCRASAEVASRIAYGVRAPEGA